MCIPKSINSCKRIIYPLVHPMYIIYTRQTNIPPSKRKIKALKTERRKLRRYSSKVGAMRDFKEENFACSSGFRSLHGSVKQRERKKFIMYSIYAWGCASTLTTVCMIMDLVPGIPENVIRPEFGKGSCWFNCEFYYFFCLIKSDIA